MASQGRGARQKGFQFERDIAKALSSETGLEFKRGLGQTRGVEDGNADVQPPQGPLRDLMHIECKRQKQCSPKAAMKQALKDIGDGPQRPIVITKDDRKPILVSMRLGDLVNVSSPVSPVKLETKNDDALVTMKFEDFLPVFKTWVFLSEHGAL